MMENNVAEKKSGGSVMVIGIVVLLCCICLLVAGLAAYAYYAFDQASPITENPIFPAENGSPTSVPESTRPPLDSVSRETLEILESTIIPPNDPKELACRMEGRCDIPDVMATSAAPRVIGDSDNFWVTDLGMNENTEVQATLRYVAPHVYFWVQDGVSYNDAEMKALMDTFEDKIYPTNREFFGSEWTPGIDGDEHIYILYSRGLGSSIAGYFSSADSVHPLVHEFSNAHEMFLFNADNTLLGD
ncbi:MAG TPA: hypothetical protein VFI68_06700, partial [Anaerolineales bacterium]|nr:hypothetical protein [Anaerolineales bacterium]